MNFYRKHKQLRKDYGYDPNPPSCRNCKHRTENHEVSIGQSVRWCGRCEFALPNTHGVCDGWAGIDGSQLERENPIQILVAHMVKDIQQRR